MIHAGWFTGELLSPRSHLGHEPPHSAQEKCSGDEEPGACGSLIVCPNSFPWHWSHMSLGITLSSYSNCPSFGSCHLLPCLIVPHSDLVCGFRNLQDTAIKQSCRCYVKEVCRASRGPAPAEGQANICPLRLAPPLVANSGLGTAHRLGARWLFDNQKGMKEENKSW